MFVCMDNNTILCVCVLNCSEVSVFDDDDEKKNFIPKYNNANLILYFKMSSFKVNISI